MKLGPFQEVILESSRVEELKEKVCLCVQLQHCHFSIDKWSKYHSSAMCFFFHLQLSEISNIPLENLDFAKVCEIPHTGHPVFLLMFLNDRLRIHLSALYRVEEHFLVIFLCWRSTRIWTGTLRC